MTHEANHRATYCPEDNKLRFYPDWDDPEFDKEDLKAVGYRWASKQECYVCPRWTPRAEDIALEFVDDIEDENYSPTERAADRAERFEGYRDRRRSDAHGFADRLGDQVAGFQDSRKAERAARKRDRLAGHAVSHWDRAEYWQRRTAGVISHALYREEPTVRRRRIKEIESKLRGEQKTLAELVEHRKRWAQVAEMDGADDLIPLDGGGYGARDEMNEAQRLAYALASDGTVRYTFKHPHDEKVNEWYASINQRPDTYCLLTRDRVGEHEVKRMTPREVARLVLEKTTDPQEPTSYRQRWLRHYQNRLDYENAMLENEGGSARDLDMKAGGFLLVRGEWRQIVKVNKSAASGKTCSVTVAAILEGAYKESRAKVEDLSADIYRAPTDEDLAALKELKKAKPKPKKAPPLINPTDNDAEALQAIWNERAREKHAKAKREGRTFGEFEPSTVCRITQAKYSAVSKGSYAKAETRTLHDGGYLSRKHSNCWSQSGQDYDSAIGEPRCKVRMTWQSGYSFWSADRVIVLTDKPQKPLPIDWAAEIELPVS